MTSADLSRSQETAKEVKVVTRSTEMRPRKVKELGARGLRKLTERQGEER